MYILQRARANSSKRKMNLNVINGRWNNQELIRLNLPKVEAAPVQSGPTGGAVKGAAKGAAAGVAIGAIAGDAGKGAAIGAAAGAYGRQKQGKTGSGSAKPAGSGHMLPILNSK